MPLLPGLQPIVDALAAPRPDGPAPRSVAELRAQGNAALDASIGALQAEMPPIAEQVDHEVPVDGATVTVRRYRPQGEGPFPAHLYLHGGGFWVGTVAQSDGPCRAVANDAGCVVLSVDYRLAPEAKFPVPLEDCYTALGWVLQNAGPLEIDPARVSIGGTSAGGNLAAAVALVARDRGGPPLVLQVLEVPTTDLTMSQPSIEENAGGPLLTKESLLQLRDYYLADPDEARHAYASPLLAADLSGLPPALVMTAELDPLRDEGEAYAQRLTEAGVVVEHVRWEGQFHGSQLMAKLIPDEAAAYHGRIVGALTRAYGSVARGADR